MSATTQIPSNVEKFLNSLPPFPAALIGCRAADASLDCCEYDIAVFSDVVRESQVIQLDGETLELHYFAGNPNESIIDLYGMTIVRDSNKFALASAAKEMTRQKFEKSLRAMGRKLLVSSLFCGRLAEGSNEMVVRHMWSKIGAYRFVSGVIALSNRRPMPLHELEQTRHMDASGAAAEGLSAALECIGLERATRPSISRSLEALRELKSGDYDKGLVMSKIDLLQSRSMLTDCYYYVGKSAGENLAKRNDAFYRRYAKLVQLALDLTNDAQEMEKLRRILFKATSAMLMD